MSKVAFALALAKRPAFQASTSRATPRVGSTLPSSRPRRAPWPQYRSIASCLMSILPRGAATSLKFGLALRQQPYYLSSGNEGWRIELAGRFALFAGTAKSARHPSRRAPGRRNCRGRMEWSAKMTMRRPLVFERDRCALLSLVVEQALDQAQKRSVHLGRNYEEDRMILVRRLVGAIESGETDPGRLRALALRPEEPRFRAA